MKKLLSLGLAAAMMLSLAACGGTSGSSSGSAAASASSTGESASGETITLRIMDSSDSTQRRETQHRRVGGLVSAHDRLPVAGVHRLL